DIPEIGKVDPADSRPVYERQQTDYIRLDWPRPWSLVTFSGKDLNAHIGVVLPNDNLFLHCPGRAAGKVIAEPLSRRPWRDTIDGYWWPRNHLETVLLLTPMTTKRAWQFVRCDGRSLGEIIEQDIVEGRDVQVQAFIDGQLVEPDDWALIPSPVNQLVIRPVVGEGEQALMIGGMLALSLLAPWAAGAINQGLALGLGKVSLGMLQAGVMMGGALALNALVGPGEGSKNASQHYTWEPQTTQRVGSFIPLVYGTYGVRGNVICSYATSEIVTETNPFNKETQVDHAIDLYWLKIAYSDGPIDGVVAGTERLNGKDPEQYGDSDDFVLEHFTGTDDQAASSVPDAFEIPVNQLCDDPTGGDNEVTTTFTAVKCDRAAVVLRFPNGFTNYSSDGDHNATTVDITVRIRESGGTWHTLADGEIWGDTTKPVRLHRWFDETYDGGSAFTLVAGTTYEVGVTRNNSRHHDHGDDFYFDCIQCAFSTAQKHPGLAYTAIGAAASKDISGAIDYYAVIKGKLVRVYDGETWSIEWSDNPAWVAYDILTRPIIKGNGGAVPYAVESYRRLDPSHLVLDDFVALADWCDTLVDNEAGGTEKRYVFNGVFDEEGSTWEQAIRVLRSACAMPYFRGNKIGVVIDKPGTPVQMFNVSNLREGFSETWIDTSEAATVYDAEFYDENADYGAESWPVPLQGAENDIPASLDCFGHTKRSRVWRYASRQLRVNQYMKRTVEIPACLDAIYTNLGDIVYVQHPSLQRATGGRIVAVYEDGVKIDKPLTMGAGDYALLIRTHDGTAERLTLYEVDEVTGAEEGDNDIVKIVGEWEYTPNVNDLWTFGEEVKVIDLYRVKGFERFGDGRVLIQAAQYTTDYYTDDEEAPKIEAKTYSQTKGGIAPSLLPTTAQAVAADRADGNSAVDTVLWEGLAFTGNAVDKVTWTCSGAGIKYKGVWCPILDDATGTTDKYIYFDPAIGDPRYLQHTNDLADLAGYERYVFCINDGGVAYFQPGKLMSSQDVKLDALDHVVQFFYQATEPTSGMAEGDYWQRDPDHHWFRYDSSAWQSVQDADVVAALNAATTAEAIADGRIVTHRGSAPPLVGHWRLNDNAASTTVVDATGNGHDGTATENTSGLSTTGKIGTALQFAIASARYVKITDHADLRMDSTGGTVSCWVKWDGDFTPTSGSSPRIWARASYVGLIVVESNGRLTGQAGGANFSTDSSQGVVAGTWTHVAVVFDPVAGTRRIYVNGVDKTTSGVSGPMPASTAYDFFLAARTADNGYFGGVIDDFRVYSRPLTQGEILKIYNGGSGTEDVKVPDKGDLWIKSSEDNKPYQWTGSAWQDAGYDVASWSKITGDHKPEDDATAGATWGEDITGQPYDQQNLVKKGTFEDGSIGTWQHSSGAFTVEDVVGQLWSKALGVSSRHAVEYNTASIDIPSCQPGEKLYLQADVNTEDSPYAFNLYVRFWKSDKTTAKWVTADTLAAGQGWTKLKGEVTVPADYIYAMVDLYSVGSSGFGTVLVTNIRMSRYNPDADVTADHQGDISIDNIQDGSSYKKLSAANLTALQSAINMDTPQPRSGWEGAFTSNSPSAGYVAWSSFVIRYQGTDYTVAASNSNKKYLYWNAGATKTQLYGTDAIGDALGSGKFIVGYNDGGTFYPAQFIKIVHGALIQAATILAEHLSVGQLSAITANLGTMTGGSITLSLGGDTRLRIDSNGLYVSNDAGSNWTEVIYNNSGVVTMKADIVEAGSIVTEAIAADAVTIERGVSTSAEVTVTAHATMFTTVQTLTNFPSAGGIIRMSGSVDLRSNTTSPTNAYVRIVRGGSAVWGPRAYIIQANTGDWLPVEASFWEQPGSGNRTYTLEVRTDSQQGKARYRKLLAAETKR
ncbi:MAG TPA: phage tail protein, partial [Sedimentisphaerales bacterium]|nr:phage tail protein [Sedimentisphaerales bacterium]